MATAFYFVVPQNPFASWSLHTDPALLLSVGLCSRNSAPLVILLPFFAELSSSTAEFECWHKTYLVGWFGEQTFHTMWNIRCLNPEETERKAGVKVF